MPKPLRPAALAFVLAAEHARELHARAPAALAAVESAVGDDLTVDARTSPAGKALLALLGRMESARTTARRCTRALALSIGQGSDAAPASPLTRMS